MSANYHFNNCHIQFAQPQTDVSQLSSLITKPNDFDLDSKLRKLKVFSSKRRPSKVERNRIKSSAMNILNQPNRNFSAKIRQAPELPNFDDLDKSILEKSIDTSSIFSDSMTVHEKRSSSKLNDSIMSDLYGGSRRRIPRNSDYGNNGTEFESFMQSIKKSKRPDSGIESIRSAMSKANLPESVRGLDKVIRQVNNSKLPDREEKFEAAKVLLSKARVPEKSVGLDKAMILINKSRLPDRDEYEQTNSKFTKPKVLEGGSGFDKVFASINKSRVPEKEEKFGLPLIRKQETLATIADKDDSLSTYNTWKKKRINNTPVRVEEKYSKIYDICSENKFQKKRNYLVNNI